FSAALPKPRDAPWLRRQANSHTPAVRVASAASSRASSGVTLPLPGEDQRRRSRVMRPLTVRTVWSSRPLLSRRRPVRGSSGGKSRFRGIDTQLEGGLVDRLAEVAQEVADGLLAVADDVAGGGAADGIGHVTAEELELVLEGLGQGLGGNGGQRVHADPRTGEGSRTGTRRN